MLLQPCLALALCRSARLLGARKRLRAAAFWLQSPRLSPACLMHSRFFYLCGYFTKMAISSVNSWIHAAPQYTWWLFLSWTGLHAKTPLLIAAGAAPPAATVFLSCIFLALGSQEELAVHCAWSKRMNINWLISDFLLCAGLTCLVVLWPLRMLARACLPKSLAFVPSALCSERRFWSVSVLSKHYRKASGWLESFCSSCSPNRCSLCSESVLRAEIWL